MTEQELDLYLTRREMAVLAVGRQVGRAFGIEGVEQMTSQQVHEALIDKREAWQNDSERGDDRFEKRLHQLTAKFGKDTPFHDAFDTLFRKSVTGLPLHSVEPYLLQETRKHSELNDSLGYNYLGDILRSSVTQESENTRRAIRLLDKLRAKATRQAERMEHKVAGPSIDASQYPCLPPLTLAIADEMAEAVGLTQEGVYALGPKKKSALVAFHQAFKKFELVQGTLAELNKFFGQRYGVEVLLEAYKKTTIGQAYLVLVAKQMKQRGLMTTKNDK